jgi:hypothetical protein
MEGWQATRDDLQMDLQMASPDGISRLAGGRR